MLKRERNIKVWIFLFITFTLILISGGKLVSSDEISMFLTVESIVKHGRLDIPLEKAINSTIVNNKAYTWYEVGNILIGIPLYLVGFATSELLTVPNEIKFLIPRTAVSLTSSFIGGFIAVVFYSLCRKMELSIRKSLSITLILIFCTFLLSYLKLFMREPLLTICLLGGFYYLFPTNDEKKYKISYFISGIFIGFGILTKLVFIINVLPIFIYILGSSKIIKQKLSDTVFFMIPVTIIGIIGTGIYNYLRFEDPFNTGYTGGTAFTTPFYVGIYGLLFSSGKGLFWFAPITILFFFSFKTFKHKYKREALLLASIISLNIITYSLYIAWGGDGSWGPRYLVPILPLILIPIAYYLKEISQSLKKMVSVLAVMGFIIQIGGTSIYAGAYIRGIGEFPFQKNFDDPEFLYKTHFIPNYSPIIGHWKMLIRNIEEHLNGNIPKLKFENTNNRLPISTNDYTQLLHTIDYWFLYAIYAGLPLKTILTFFIVLVILSGISYYNLRKSIKYFYQTKLS